MKQHIDISLPLGLNIPIWPNSEGITVIRTQNLDNGDPSNNSRIIADVHTGTHIDAPLHYIKEGKSVDEINTDVLIGPTFVAEFPNQAIVTKKDLEMANIPENTERLLIKTQNSQLLTKGDKFTENFVGLSSDAAQWVVNKEIRLIGIDYLSIQPYSGFHKTHEILLKEDIVIVEGLNLTDVMTGIYQLICLPIKIEGAEGAPARAILVKTS
ncbi:cyclase family protein [Methanogenium cariaci]|jgi:arylformamidase|uniref:cyclase family protein n=1 Tax=Methanogenium cariaci TaxID=2197 RepID=UPI0007831EA7|nr:cyclase family protein [Methanogenium cariaci]